LLLTAANQYHGTTTVSGGRLEIGVGGLPGTGAITLGRGAVLAFHLTADLVLPNTITGLGTVVSLNAPYRVYWNGGSTAPFGTGIYQIVQGQSVDFSTELLAEGEILAINAGTIKVTRKQPQVVRNLVTMETSADFSILEGSSLTLKGNVSGDGVLRKRSMGILTLEGENTYFGGDGGSGRNLGNHEWLGFGNGRGCDRWAGSVEGERERDELDYAGECGIWPGN